MACRAGLGRAQPVGVRPGGWGDWASRTGNLGSMAGAVLARQEEDASWWLDTTVSISSGQHTDTLLFAGGWVAAGAPRRPCSKRRGDSGRGGPLSTESYIGAGRWSCCAGASRRPELPGPSRRGWELYGGPRRRRELVQAAPVKLHPPGIGHGGSGRAVRAAGLATERNPALLFSVEKTNGQPHTAPRAGQASSIIGLIPCRF